LPFGEAETRFYAAVLVSAKKAGKPVMSADAMIAATAHAHGMAVATRDLAGFAGAGISLINPWEA
jgi:predicted nucleic acid-binding protein